MYFGNILGSLTHAVYMPRFPVGQLNRRRKEARENIINLNRSLSALQNEANQVKQEVDDKTDFACTSRKKKKTG